MSKPKSNSGLIVPASTHQKSFELPADSRWIEYLGEAVRTECRHRRVLLRCQCGTTKDVEVTFVKNGHIRSCGCLKKYTASKLNFTHGHSRDGKEHPLYGIWQGIKRRCLNSGERMYHNYGGRGIGICSEWIDDFPAFLNWSLENGYEKGLSIDRIDNDLGYSPENCRWATGEVQQNNKRTNVLITMGCCTLTISQWARELSVSADAIYKRKQRAWLDQECLLGRIQ